MKFLLHVCLVFCLLIQISIVSIRCMFLKVRDFYFFPIVYGKSLHNYKIHKKYDADGSKYNGVYQPT